MSVLVDTSVWSLSLRRRGEEQSPPVQELRALILEGRARIMGPVRQEILSGIRERTQFERLRKLLGAFPDLELRREDHELAAEFFNVCRRSGIQGSNTDFLICAVAERRELPILTTDRDFDLFSRHLPIALHAPRSE